MTSEECELAFDRLEHAMREAGLAWVTNQVAEDIRFGKTRTKRLFVHQERADVFAVELSAEAPRRSNVTVSATEPYSSDEKLKMLLRALEQTTIAISRMEDAIRNRLNKGSETKDWRSVQLIRTDEPDRKAVVIESSALGDRSVPILELEKLLQSLRERI